MPLSTKWHVRNRPRFWGSTQGTTQVLPFLVGTLVFAGTFGVVVHDAVNTSRQASEVSEANLAAEAVGIADAILGSPGKGWYTSVNCAAGGQATASNLKPDALQRLGLAAEPSCAQPGSAFNLSYDKIENLGQAMYDPNPANGKVDYLEARKSLGLERTGEDFHIRSWPVLQSTQSILEKGYRDPNQKVAYIGAYEEQNSQGGQGQKQVNFQIQKSCGMTDGIIDGTGLLYTEAWVDVTNNGTTAAGFELQFSVPLKDKTVVVLRHTPIIPAPIQIVTKDPITGAILSVITEYSHHKAVVRLAKTSDWEWAGAAEVSVTIGDNARKVGDCKISYSGVTMTTLTKVPLVQAWADRLENVLKNGKTSPDPQIYYQGYDGRGNPADVTAWNLYLYNSLGVQVASKTDLKKGGGSASFSLTVADTYHAKLMMITLIERSSDYVNVLTTEGSSFTPSTQTGSITYVPKASVVPEISYLSDLVQAFAPKVYSNTYSSAQVPYAAGGDVFPDQKKSLNDDLRGYLIDDQGDADPSNDVATLANYNVLVVGSNVAHSAMTSQTIKDAIKDWVYAGGELVVFGSSAQAVEWLKPIFDAGLKSASGGISTPDVDHPILKSPNKLDYSSYSSFGTAWDYGGGADAGHFSHVVVQDAKDVLAVSNAGEFGLGTVVLTSFQPWDIGANGGPVGNCVVSSRTSDCQSLQAIQNFLTLQYRAYYLDYGPAIPNGKDVGVTSRLVTVYDPLTKSMIEMQVQIFVF